MAKAKKATAAELASRVTRYASLNEKRKELEKEEELLKEWFREQSGGKDVTFSNGQHDVLVTKDSRTSLDQKALTLKHGAAFLKPFQKSTSFLKVSVRQVEGGGA